MRLDFPKSNPLNLIAKLLLNSLYGRFGMIDEFPDIAVFKDKNSFNEFMNIPNLEVSETIELGDKLLVQYSSDDKNQQTMLYGNLETHNTNIAIASAITGYARIHMSYFKNNPDYILYYSDTDSIYISKPLSDDLVNSKVLGKMKLENILNRGVFLAPKVYYLITEDNNHIYKVKGLSHNIELTKNDFENLLVKDSFLKRIQTK
jgi:DNA polymerase elongation subunit (family B)